MKKLISASLAVIMVAGVGTTQFLAACTTKEAVTGTPDISFDVNAGLYAHAVAEAEDTDAWSEWQNEHDEDFNIVNSDVKYFFLPSSADASKVELYNAYGNSVTVNGTKLDAGESKLVDYELNTKYSVKVGSATYSLIFMKSNAEAAIYVNNTDVDGEGTDLMTYLNADKSLSSKATGAIVEKDGSIDNTVVKKIKGRGNTTWGKPKKAYNITYDGNVSIAGMNKSKKYSILANYQDDSLSRNRFLYDLSDAVGMPYASDSRYVDFYVNGFYWGSYQMTEKIETGKNTLMSDIDDKAYLNEDGTVNKDFPFVCEVDASAVEGEDYFIYTASKNNLTLKAPELSVGDVGYDEVLQYAKEKFDAFFNAVKDNAANLEDYCDIDSVTKMYLINELGKNWDAGVSSLYFTYKQDENGNYKFYGSPVWDYDNSLGNAVGVGGDLRSIGVTDYTEYTGWWCQYKGKSTRTKTSSNIMNNIARNKKILAEAPQIWFNEFVPAINAFAGSGSKNMKSADEYYSLIKDSAEMNYQSGWLLNTGGWIADHSEINPAAFDMKTKTYTVSDKTTYFDNDFTGMFNYAKEWMLSRAAWLSSQMIANYKPTYELGDVDGNGKVDVNDVTLMQRYFADMAELTDAQIAVIDVNGDGKNDVNDATELQRMLVV